MIYLDLDGPMVRWTKGVFSLYGRQASTVEENVTDLPKALGVSKSDMYAKITKAGAKWWAELEPQPWARELYNELSKMDDVVISTSPGRWPAAAAGKMFWMQNFFGKEFDQYVITRKKELTASKEAVLIDDQDKNVSDFIHAGGVGIIFPRGWNKAASDSHRAVEKVLEDLSQIYPSYTPPSGDEYDEYDNY